jgi:hypothetical protein
LRTIFDEHVSPRIVRALENNARLSPNWTLEHVIGSKYASVEDEDWFVAFRNDGGEAVISADRKMLRRKTLLRGISETGLVTIYLPREYAEGRRLFQLAYLAFWWDQIVQELQHAAQGDILSSAPPHRFRRLQEDCGKRYRRHR